jgi:hypothetical protein
MFSFISISPIRTVWKDRSFLALAEVMPVTAARGSGMTDGGYEKIWAAAEGAEEGSPQTDDHNRR